MHSLIYCYWELQTNTPLDEPFRYRVVADGCIDVFFEANNSSENFVMGFCKKYTEFPLDKEFHYIGIRFLPTAFPQLFQIDAAKLSNQYQHLAQVHQQFSSDLSTGFSQLKNTEQLVGTLDDVLQEAMKKTNFNWDNRLYEAIDLILDNYGGVNLEADLKTGISSRQLRRLFKYYIGDTPKTFSKVVRFQNILKAKPSTQSLRKNKLFFDFGFFDQAHFIKDFKHFYGVTPSKAFGRA